MNRYIKKLLPLLFLFCITPSFATYILIPMDMNQKNHLKAYGIAYFTIARDVEVSWLLNYRGGSFMCQYSSAIEDECIVRDVSYQVIADVQAAAIRNEIASLESNTNEVKLNKVPKIAVYTPKSKLPWDEIGRASCRERV